MNIFAILNNLYTNKKSNWIAEVEDREIQPYVLQRWLCMNDALRKYARWLDKYIFVLSPKMYLSLAWSVIPKSDKAPRINYIKQLKEETDLHFILKKVRHHFKFSDNDYEANRLRIIKAIQNDMENWFSFYGIERRHWKKYHLDFNRMKTFNVQTKEKTLTNWG